MPRLKKPTLPLLTLYISECTIKAGKIALMLILLVLFMSFNCVLLNAQQRTVGIQAGTKILAAKEGELPFWQFSNVLGTVDQSGTNYISFTKAQTKLYDAENFHIGANMTVLGRLSNDNSLHLPKYRFSINWHDFQFDVGRFARPVGFNNHNLSTGSMIESNNAIPLNRIMVSNPVYKQVPFTNGVVEYKGKISHGWFSDERFTRDAFLHQKDLFAKINLNNISLKGGLSHNVMWGGSNEKNGKLPSGFGDFIDVFFGKSADQDDNVPEGEITNRLGNILLYFAFALDYEHDRFDLSLTRSFLKEDTGSKATRSPWDGIFGVNFSFEENKPLFGFLDNILYEYINTIRQQAKDEEARGRANFYNNTVVYKNGWTSKGRVIANSLAIFDSEIDPDGRVSNNMFIGHNLGLEGELSEYLAMKLLITYSRNYGRMKDRRNDLPREEGMDRQSKKLFRDRSEFRKDQYSLRLAADYAISSNHKWVINTSLNWDTGELYTDNVGFSLGITWNNIFNY